MKSTVAKTKTKKRALLDPAPHGIQPGKMTSTAGGIGPDHAGGVVSGAVECMHAVGWGLVRPAVAAAHITGRVRLQIPRSHLLPPTTTTTTTARRHPQESIVFP